MTPAAQAVGRGDASPRHLGFVTARPGIIRDGALWVDAGLGRVVDALARSYARTTVALSIAPEHHPLFDHRLEVGLEDVVPLPWLPSFVGGFGKWREARAAIREVERRTDVVLVQLPFAAPLALARPARPRVYHVCADVREIVRQSTYYRGPRGVLARATALGVEAWSRRLAAWPQARAVTHGDELRRGLRIERGRSVVSSSLLEREIQSVRRRRDGDAAFRVLFVGYLRHEKGVDTLLEAMQRLLHVVPTAELGIVGATNAVDHGTEASLRRGLEELGRKTRVSYHGNVGFGPDLFQLYADADVLVVPSRSEGTPRVLVEARAFGCPVVASRVGGIPSSVEDGVDGLLVEPGDGAALAAALAQVAQNAALRARLVEGGLRRARRTTVEAFAAEIAEEIDLAAQSAAQ